MLDTLDPAIANDWFAVADSQALRPGSDTRARLLGHDLVLARRADGSLAVHLADDDADADADAEGSADTAPHARDHCGCVWVCMGAQPRPLFALPEFEQPGRRFIYMGGIGLHTGGLRVVENFLDMAHFPFVHAHILGAEPITEVREYEVELDGNNELWARGCQFVQPRASAASVEPTDIGYTYRVVNPFTPLLYKHEPGEPDRQDIIFLSVQPTEEDRCIAHFAISLFDDSNSDGDITHFQQTILGQDKPILENHTIKRLPLDPAFEVPSRADAASAAFRRWLRDIELRFGVEPPASAAAGPLDAAGAGRRPMRVARKWPVATDVTAFELEAADDGALPAAAPGAHLDVQLPSGLIRQYSVCQPGEAPDRYLIAVKREPESRGGSASLHERVQVGDLLRVGPPRNHFPLVREAGHSLLLAGGIGLTPLLAMARALARAGRSFELHVFARSLGHVPFGADLAQEFHGRLHLHLGLDAPGTQHMLHGVLDAPGADTHVYGCGPAPFMQAIAEAARARGCPEARVHFEHFKAPAAVSQDGPAFELRLARSGLSTTVRSGQSAVEAIRALGLAVETNCEQGVCGTCQCGLLAGEPDHRDVCLSAAERRSGRHFIPCVSRARGTSLVLDL